MSLVADLHLARGAFALSAELVVDAGETVALVGPNGAGKSSCLHAIAGLLRVERGRVELDGEMLDGGPRGAFVPPEARRVGLLFQQPLLFPNLSVLDNVAYGLVSRGRGRRDARELARGWIERVGLAGLEASRPGALSGGQAQRAALARALASEPRALLFDEPLAAVDATGRLELRRELRAHLAEFPGPRLAVVHDVADALALADRLVVLEAGRVVQAGTADEIARKPRSRYVADLVGLNCFHGTCQAGVVTTAGGELVVATDREGPVLVTVHPRAVSLFRERPAGSPRNVWRARVAGTEALLDRVRVRLDAPLPIVAEVTPAAVAELRLARGAEVWVALKATELAVSSA